ncbi:undecaprenyl-diphosphate phosphatase [Roseinatronobacter alkalisoli]|uniref:Undecaprenyl-diphosphatase n=1 Tax=Roseinatronobacter alkalisoli TaxID=3028235 RepID=A0ABT5TE51_9RHOB|nr:undecaprenyl-diphosphate phosphatase [Roseinatronobacter sp. HJB301]MDD7973395.1 undecaprenyl-diphosphate phosphatase [Roseinatronobacter sp. HJB301]
MTYLEAIVLGLVQGIFMFVPVSSTAHLVLTQHLMIAGGSQMPAPESAAMILFDLVVHVGTLVSIAVVFWQSLRTLMRATVSETLVMLRPKDQSAGLGPFSKLMLMGVITVGVTGVLGLLLKRSFEAVFGSPQILVVTLLITAILLFLTDRLGKRPLGIKSIGPRIAVIIGVAQALALIPGISRSGITIIAGLFTGLKRRWAAEYSFLVAIPTILAAGLLQGVEVYRGEGIEGIGAGPMLAGFIVAAISGTIALRLVLALLFKAQLKVFSVYLICIAALIGFGVLDGVI